MAKLTIIGRDGRTETITHTGGWTVMEIIRAAGFHELLATCGGNCCCATCHVYLEEGPALPPPGADEGDLLEALDHRAERSRLSCQILFDEALDGLTVRIAPEE